MKTGSVFCWKNYPFQKDGQIKTRWFIYLGESKSDPLEDNPELIGVIVSTTTAKVEYYEKGGERHSHPHIKFEPSLGIGFEKACILDLQLPPEALSKSAFQKYVDIEEIKVVGNIPENLLRAIYEKICSPSYKTAYSLKLKRDIYSNLNAIGITGLSLPKAQR